MRKKIIVVGGLFPMHQKLADHGADITLIIEKTKMNYDYMDLYSNIVYLTQEPFNDIRWLIEIKELHKNEPYMAVGAFHEFNQELAHLVASELNLAFNKYSTLKTIRNKFIMREVLSKNQIDDTPFKDLGGLHDLEVFIENHSYPVIVKPKDGWASESVLKLGNTSDFAELSQQVIQGLFSLNNMMVEKFIDGQEYSVETISEDYYHKVICITQKLKNEKFIETGHIIPARVSKEQCEIIIEKVTEMLDCFGIRDGVTHTEVIIKDSKLGIVETHTRPAGGYIPELLAAAFDIDLMDLWARQLLGEKIINTVLPFNEQNFQLYAGITFKLPKINGYINNIFFAEEESDPSIIKVQSMKKIGDKVKENTSLSRLAYCMSKGTTPEKVVEQNELQLKNIHFKFSNYSNKN